MLRSDDFEWLRDQMRHDLTEARNADLERGPSSALAALHRRRARHALRILTWLRGDPYLSEGSRR